MPSSLLFFKVLFALVIVINAIVVAAFSLHVALKFKRMKGPDRMSSVLALNFLGSALAVIPGAALAILIIFSDTESNWVDLLALVYGVFGLGFRALTRLLLNWINYE